MRKKIGRKIYDTDKSDYIGRNSEGLYGDPTGFEEFMYKKGQADFFLLVSGGPESQYPTEDILPLSVEDAEEWIGRVLGAEAVAEFVSDKDRNPARLRKLPLRRPRLRKKASTKKTKESKTQKK
jgi:hypothetical protein